MLIIISIINSTTKFLILMRAHSLVEWKVPRVTNRRDPRLKVLGFEYESGSATFLAQMPSFLGALTSSSGRRISTSQSCYEVMNMKMLYIHAAEVSL